MQLRGKLVILLMFLLALGLSGYAWWHRYQENPRNREFWGSQAMMAIRRAPKVEFFVLRPINATSAADAEVSTMPSGSVVELIPINGVVYSAQLQDISASPGLIHARHGLTDDQSYVWTESQDITQADWEFGIRFGNSSTVTVVFDKEADTLFWLEKQKGAQIAPLSAKAFRKKRLDWEGK